jgi:hypothetical protein
LSSEAFAKEDEEATFAGPGIAFGPPSRYLFGSLSNVSAQPFAQKEYVFPS